MAVIPRTNAAAVQEARKEVPSKLSRTEKWLAALVIIAGIAVVVIVLAMFATDGKWLTEETVTNGTGDGQTVTTKKYSDSLPLAALGIGGLLVLCGAFFGRLREVTLPGGSGIKFQVAEQQLEQQIETEAQAAAASEGLPPEKAAELKATAKETGTARLQQLRAAAEGASHTELVEQIAKEAVEAAKGKVSGP